MHLSMSLLHSRLVVRQLSNPSSYRSKMGSPFRLWDAIVWRPKTVIGGYTRGSWHGSSVPLSHVQLESRTVPLIAVMSPENERQIEIAMGYFELGMLDDAIVELASLGSRGRFSVLSAWSAGLRMAERWSEMLPLTRKMVELYPTEAECWASLADATRNSVSLEAGLELLETARHHFPDDGHILFQIGCYCCQLGRLDEARTALREAVSSNRVWAKIAVQDRDLSPLWPEFKNWIRRL